MRIQLAQPLCPLDPTDDLPGFLAWHRAAFGDLRMEGNDESDGESDGGESGEAAGAGDSGDSEADDGKDWKAEAAKWKAQSRKHEDRAKANAAAAKERDALKHSQLTEQEKAVEAAKAEARAEALKESAPRLVGAEFRAAAKGMLTDAQRDAFLEDADLTKYLTDTGEVDVEKVEKKVAALAPAKGEDDGKQKRFPDLGQGKRATKPAAGVATGKEMYEARRGTKAAS